METTYFLSNSEISFFKENMEIFSSPSKLSESSLKMFPITLSNSGLSFIWSYGLTYKFHVTKRCDQKSGNTHDDNTHF